MLVKSADILCPINVIVYDKEETVKECILG